MKMETEQITSGQNPKIKDLLSLQEKSRERRERGLFVVEGRRELAHCLAAGFVPDAVFYCPEIFDSAVFPDARPLPEGQCRIQQRYSLPEETKIFEVSRNVYEKIAYRGGTEGIVAEIKARTLRLEDLKLRENPLVIVLESVEKPGNLGAVLRSADAAGADAVIVCDPITDLYNPNLIRASLGALFTVPTLAATSEETIAWLKARHIHIFTAQLQDSELYSEADFRGPSALVMGTESTGLTDLWRRAADKHIRIPMRGALDSLNVSVSAAILLFEALRQRGA